MAAQLCIAAVLLRNTGRRRAPFAIGIVRLLIDREDAFYGNKEIQKYEGL